MSNKAENSLLNRDIAPTDLRRISNLIKGNKDKGSDVMIGYESETSDRKEGDVWEEGGKKWTIKNGIKTSIGKLNSFRNIFKIPFKCPKCDKHMTDDDFNRKTYYIRRYCSNCFHEEETLKILDGTYDTHKEISQKNDKDYFLTQITQIFKDAYKDSGRGSGVYTEDGTIERWVGGRKMTEEEYNAVMKFIDDERAKI